MANPELEVITAAAQRLVDEVASLKEQRDASEAKVLERDRAKADADFQKDELAAELARTRINAGAEKTQLQEQRDMATRALSEERAQLTEVRAQRDALEKRVKELEDKQGVSRG